MSDYNEPWTTGHDGHGAMSIDDNHGNQICYVRNIEKSRRIVACVNAFAGIPIDKIEGKSIAEFVADESFLTGFSAGHLGLEGIGPSMIAHHLAGMVAGSDAPNYLEISFTHEEVGNISVTIQRESGKTAHMLRIQAEQQRDKLLAALKEIKHSMGQALIPGNDKRREIELSNNIACSAINEIEAEQ